MRRNAKWRETTHKRRRIDEIAQDAEEAAEQRDITEGTV